MKTCVILNRNAGASEQSSALREALRARPDTACWETAEPGDGVEFAARAVSEGFELVAAAGGDGTVNEVVNGLMRADGAAVLGVIPLGTGNDLARLLDISQDPRDAVALLRAGAVEPIDLFLVESESERIYGINAAAGGFSGEVDEAVTTELKSNWGPLAYIIGAVSALPDLRNYETYIGYEGGPGERVGAMNVIVANGRTVAGGRRVAPLSDPQDGLLDVVVVLKGSVVEMGQVAARLAAGNYLESPHVLHRKVGEVYVRSVPGMWFNVDGELFTREPVTIKVCPAALRVVVGNHFRHRP